MASPASTKGAFDHAEVNNWITTVFAPDRLNDSHRPDDGPGHIHGSRRRLQSGRSNPTLRPDALYEFVIASDGGTREDRAFRMSFGEPDADGHQETQGPIVAEFFDVGGSRVLGDHGPAAFCVTKSIFIVTKSDYRVAGQRGRMSCTDRRRGCCAGSQ